MRKVREKGGAGGILRGSIFEGDDFRRMESGKWGCNFFFTILREEGEGKKGDGGSTQRWSLKQENHTFSRLGGKKG